MRFKIPILDKAIELKFATFLVIERYDIFANVVRLLYNNDVDQIKIFDAKMNNLKMSELMIVSDILGYDCNTTSVLKLVHEDLLSQLNEKPEIKTQIEDLLVQITDIVAIECLEQELNLIYEECTISKLIKALGVKIENGERSIFEKCFDIIQIFKYLNNKKLLVFINVCSYFSKVEIIYLIEFIILNNCEVLFIEPRKVYDISQYVIDEDYFLMLENQV